MSKESHDERESTIFHQIEWICNNGANKQTRVSIGGWREDLIDKRTRRGQTDTSHTIVIDKTSLETLWNITNISSLAAPRGFIELKENQYHVDCKNSIGNAIFLEEQYKHLRFPLLKLWFNQSQPEEQKDFLNFLNTQVKQSKIALPDNLLMTPTAKTSAIPAAGTRPFQPQPPGPASQLPPQSTTSSFAAPQAPAAAVSYLSSPVAPAKSPTLPPVQPMPPAAPIPQIRSTDQPVKLAVVIDYTVHTNPTIKDLPCQIVPYSYVTSAAQNLTYHPQNIAESNNRFDFSTRNAKFQQQLERPNAKQNFNDELRNILAASAYEAGLTESRDYSQLNDDQKFELACILFIAIKNGGISGNEGLRGSFLDSYKKLYNPSPEMIKPIFRFSRLFQQNCAGRALYSGNPNSAELVGMRLKRINPLDLKELIFGQNHEAAQTFDEEMKGHFGANTEDLARTPSKTVSAAGYGVPLQVPLLRHHI